MAEREAGAAGVALLSSALVPACSDTNNGGWGGDYYVDDLEEGVAQPARGQDEDAGADDDNGGGQASEGTVRRGMEGWPGVLLLHQPRLGSTDSLSSRSQASPHPTLPAYTCARANIDIGGMPFYIYIHAYMPYRFRKGLCVLSPGQTGQGRKLRVRPTQAIQCQSADFVLPVCRLALLGLEDCKVITNKGA